LHKTLDHEEITFYAPSIGFLQDGRKYLVCRAMLYTDDFQAHVSRNGSYGGCYMLPFGIGQRNEQDILPFVAFLSLSQTYPQTRCYCALYPTCTKTGIEGKDANGERVTIFLDIVGYIGDYPAVTHALDVLGQNFRAP
jgi:hypothetical protein